MFVAAAVQLQCTSDAARNQAAAERLIRRAAACGATFVATPENTDFLGPHDQKVRRAEPLDGPVCSFYAGLAQELGIHLLLGSFAERKEGDSARCHNTSVLFGPDGQRLASYRKIHLFDVDLGAGVSFRESATVAAGREPVVARTELGAVGMSICYDLRFPELYRALVDQGARILTVPSAFTLATGKDHWEPLVRARAIETQCFVVAPGQWGRHDDGGQRQSWGHSMIVDPWGAVLAQAPDGEGLAIAEIELSHVDRVRHAIPIGNHRVIGR